MNTDNKKKSIMDVIDDFLTEAYSEMNVDPNRILKRDELRNEIFTYSNEYFLFRATMTRSENPTEFHVLYLRKTSVECDPIWSLIYRSKATLKKDMIHSIQGFRRHVYVFHKYNSEILPIRGPEECVSGKYEYKHVCAKDWDDIRGRNETILYNKQVVYEASYDGGFTELIPALEKKWESLQKSKPYLDENEAEDTPHYIHIKSFLFAWNDIIEVIK